MDNLNDHHETLKTTGKNCYDYWKIFNIYFFQQSVVSRVAGELALTKCGESLVGMR